MNNTRIPLDQPEVFHNALDRIKVMIERLESGALKTGDNLGYDDLQVMSFIGYPSSIITNAERLLILLKDKLENMRSLSNAHIEYCQDRKS